MNQFERGEIEYFDPPAEIVIHVPVADHTFGPPSHTKIIEASSVAYRIADDGELYWQIEKPSGEKVRVSKTAYEGEDATVDAKARMVIKTKSY